VKASSFKARRGDRNSRLGKLYRRRQGAAAEPARSSGCIAMNGSSMRRWQRGAPSFFQLPLLLDDASDPRLRPHGQPLFDAIRFKAGRLVEPWWWFANGLAGAGAGLQFARCGSEIEGERSTGSRAGPIFEDLPGSVIHLKGTTEARGISSCDFNEMRDLPLGDPLNSSAQVRQGPRRVT